MTSSTLTRLREILEELEEQTRIGEKIHAEAKRQYDEAERRKQARYARIRAEHERRNRPLLSRLREALFPG